MFTLEIMQSAYASVQDGGRIGAEHWGVARAGFADSRHGRLANALCGNGLNVAALEIFVGRFIARFRQDSCFATAGAAVKLYLDGKEVPVGARILAAKGSVLSLGPTHSGRIVYLALPGGIAVESILESGATDLGAGFGGLEGRLLRAGDQLQCNLADVTPARTRAFLAPPPRVQTLRFVPDARLESTALAPFIGTAWRVHPQSQRSGTRLVGTALPALSHDGISRAVVPGVIQLPPDGLPIILGVDAQTIGGYPVLGTLVSADLWRMSQLSAMQEVQFEPCTLARAYRLAEDESTDFARALMGIKDNYGIVHER